MTNTKYRQTLGVSPTVLLFGSLALSFDAASFHQLRKAVTGTKSLTWLWDALSNLADDCEVIFAALPTLNQAHVCDQLLDIRDALATGRSLRTVGRLPNSALVPLVIATHLAQYVSLLQHNGLTHEEYVAGKDGETLGLCTGLLGAFAVAGSRSHTDLEKYGAATVRLGLLVGLAVDLGYALSPSKSLSVGWSSSKAHDAMVRTLKDIPGAYISVGYDENRATVTATASAIPQLQSKLRSLGLTTSEISLHGRFHSPENREMLEHILAFCDKHAGFQLPDASCVAIPTISDDVGGQHLTQGALHVHALRAILVDSPTWYKTLSAAWTEKNDSTVLVSFGTERCVPPSVLRKVSARLVHLADSTVEGNTSKAEQGRESYPERPWQDSDIAVVGMACKLPGANDVTEFWDLLASAKPQHQEIGAGHPRFDFADTPTRSVDDPGMRRKWFANLVSGADQFDHRFFKKSPRESASMDPAQRIMLQVAYQAVEQSGYLNSHGTSDVGVFLGTTGNDYQANAASQAANAFTTTGNLQGFLAGKVSHTFGWTGPAMVVDTACSGSLVAIHQACSALVSGECSAALAGGAHVMTQPAWFQNLAAGQFLSPTGQCKPFDAAADGYCRGEGVGAVFLKRMDRAVADGDSILGIIAATAVQQNQNCTPIFVPNVPSLGDLFRTVTTKARVKPSQISVVEAHGTGTPVGDPAEYASIKAVLGGGNHTAEKPLILGSVKGLIGHLEGTSGVVAMIKLLLMLHVGLIPPQASFNTINPAIGARPEDNMIIPTKEQPWDADFRIALINNYGASGSNASMVLAQPPMLRAIRPNAMPTGVKYPFWLSAHDSDGLLRRAKALRKYLDRVRSGHSLANLSYNVARQNNRTLDHSVVLSITSLDELNHELATLDKGEARSAGNKVVVLCFGGQVSTSVGLDRQVYESTALLKRHIDHVDAVARALGVDSIFPGIFERTPIQDTVRLQVTLFAMQYACTRSWLDSGLKPAAVVGHSFGELTALCISQALSLEDTIRMIVNRATLVRDAWGPDKGAMMAVSDVDLANVQKMLHEANSRHDASPASVACYNGPRSFTLAGSTVAIDAVADTLVNSSLAGAKSKRLNTSNAFHCALVDDLIDRLEKSAQGLTFREPVIPIERATESPASTGNLGPKFVADHMRNPVYFHHALERLAAKHTTSSLVFLEAGSNSTITHMASRALANNANLKNAHFQAVNITNCDDGWNKLVDTTLGLWRAGLAVHHWAHHPLQARASTDLSPLLLPPYQFDPDARHWIDLKIPPKHAPVLPATAAISPNQVANKPEEEGLVTFAGYQDGSAQKVARFRINTSSPKFEKLLAGHMTIQTAPICPATVQIGLVIEGLANIRSVYKQTGCTPQFRDIQYQSPVCANDTRTTWIEASEEGGSEDDSNGWRFEVFSTEISTTSNKETKMLHTTGQVIFMHSGNASLQRELSYFPRLFGHGRATDLLTRPDVDEVLAQRNIYRVFAEIVDYGDEYRGLRKVVGRGNEAAGVVVPVSSSKNHAETDGLRFNPHLSDTFCQVPGIWANFLTSRSPNDAYLANGIAQWIRAPAKDTTPSEIHVFTTMHRSSDKVWLSDVFVFDAADGSLLEVILGIAYYQIPKSAMSKLLQRLSDPRWLASNIATSRAPDTVETSNFNKPVVHVPQQPTTPMPPPTQQTTKAVTKAPKADNDILERVKFIIADLSGLETAEIKADSELADLGIDSLVGMELINELEAAFKVKLPESEIQAVTDIPGLMKCMVGTLGAEASDVSDGEDSGTFTPNNTLWDTGRTTPISLHAIEKDGGYAGTLLPFDAVMGAFNEVKARTDERIADVKQTRYVADVLPLQDELTVALALEAFEERGAGIRNAQPGQTLARISHGAEHRKLVTYLYRMLESLTQIIKIDGEDSITRTAVPLPPRSSRAVYDDLTTRFPDQQTADKLTYYAGTNLARVLSGATDGVKLIFGSSQGRELAAGLYGDWPLNRATYAGVEDFLTRLAARLQSGSTRISTENPLRILEMGAGTGGTTKRLVPLLAKLGMPVEYTFTDLSPSLVAQARKTWAKQYPFMRFAAHDMEKPPAPEFVGTQHLVVASNAVHATHSLQVTTRYIRSMLRPDGFLCLVEMTRPMYWVDIVFGLFEGWWMYEDGREHVIAHEERWQADLQASGYGHVDWIDGASEESKIWKFIIAAANPESRYERVPNIPQVALTTQQRNGGSADCDERERVVAKYVAELAAGWDKTLPASDPNVSHTFPKSYHKCVLITGGTGGLGSHLIAKALAHADVTRVVCLNRRNNKQEARQRQMQSLVQKGTGVSPDDVADRIEVIETDLSKPNLGLSKETYNSLTDEVTHIVHNAWLMHSKWPVKRFEPQLRIMANMLSLARDISTRRGPGSPPVTFEFVSSVATVGHHPIWTGQPVVPEARVPINSVLPTGYGDAKYICERLLDATLHRHPARFRAAVVRLGQIAGSRQNGYWNPAEHVFFLVKSSQTLGALPDFGPAATLGWTPVEDVAGALVDVLLLPDDVRLHPVYHVENPVRQRWNDMVAVLASELGFPAAAGAGAMATLPFPEWVRRVRGWPVAADNTAEGANPAFLLADFLDENFVRISCGGLLMGTARAREHSLTLARVGPVRGETVGLFVAKWREMGVLR
ncbi:putative polyketide synthase [Hypoxylon sp. NC1633]|nr:putative polyketide synthase [Hypoxylon sp. NC1633]